MREWREQQGREGVQVDAGGYFEPLGPRSTRVNETMIESLERLPLDVLNLTPADLHEWARLSGLQGRTRIISTNLKPRDASVATPQPTAVIELATPEGLVKIGFLGVSDPAAVRPNSGFRAIAPREALEASLPDLARQADLVVLLADLPLPDAIQLAETFREIDVIVRPEPRSVSPPPQVAGNAVVVSSVERGRSLGKLSLELNADGEVDSARPEWIVLDDKIPEDPYFRARQAELEGP